MFVMPTRSHFTAGSIRLAAAARLDGTWNIPPVQRVEYSGSTNR